MTPIFKKDDKIVSPTKGIIATVLSVDIETNTIEFSVHNGDWDGVYDYKNRRMKFLDHPLNDTDWHDVDYQFEIKKINEIT